jgi:hypothetical protein
MRTRSPQELCGRGRTPEHAGAGCAGRVRFTLSDDEFITGTPKEAAQTIIEQCRAVGAGHFLTVLNWSAPVDEVAQAHDLFGREVIPLLRKA